MLRRITGWRRMSSESWRDTMKRMIDRLNAAHELYPWQVWSMRFARDQWRIVHHPITGPYLVWARTLSKYNSNPHTDPVTAHSPFYRSPRHPRMRWDDNIHRFCRITWPDLRKKH